MKKKIVFGILLFLSLTFCVLGIIGFPINKRYSCYIETTVGKEVAYKAGMLELDGQLKFNIINTDWNLTGYISIDGERMNMNVSGDNLNYLIGIVKTEGSKIHSNSQITIMTVFDNNQKGKIFNDRYKIAFPSKDLSSYNEILKEDGIKNPW